MFQNFILLSLVLSRIFSTCIFKFNTEYGTIIFNNSVRQDEVFSFR